MATQSTLFAFESRSDALDDLARLVFLNGLPGDLVVHQCGAVVLQRSSQFIDDCLVGALLSLLAQNQVHLDDLLVGVGQIVLTSHRARHCNGGTNRRRSDWEVPDDGPVRTAILGIKTHKTTVIIGDALKNFDGLVWPKCFFAVPRVVKVLITILDVDRETKLSKLRLLVATATFLTLTYCDALSKVQHSLESGLAISYP